MIAGYIAMCPEACSWRIELVLALCVSGNVQIKKTRFTAKSAVMNLHSGEACTYEFFRQHRHGLKRCDTSELLQMIAVDAFIRADVECKRPSCDKSW